MMKQQNDFTARKERKKKISVLIQTVILLVIAGVIINAQFTLKSYQPYDNRAVTAAPDKGFVTLSYFGVARVGDQELIGVNRLREHLQGLKKKGYVTITQQDVVQYYERQKNLPEKSVMLIFEDGRRDTAIFAHKILEDLNYKATMLSYAEKFDNRDPKFLLPADMQAMVKTTFWELGTNGYRLSFINIFDRYNNYLGELEPLAFKKVAPYLKRRYNHFLMDYVRDEDGIPKESYNKMKARVAYDYERLRDIYTKELGYVPGMHILMHSNTGSFGNNDKVSALNEAWMKELFTMNFNREGFCWNRRNSSIYDLTRMQPQPYWYTNHVLMRIKYDINQDLEFVKGDMNKQQAWETLQGALEIKDETMILTSLPLDRGLMRLKNSSDFVDVKLSVRLRGNRFGLQKIYLRADADQNRYVAVSIFNNFLYVTEKSGGTEKELFRLNLDRHDGKPIISIPEHKKEAEIKELETFIQYADTVERAKIYTERLRNRQLEPAPTVAEGAPEFIPDLSVHAIGDRRLAIAVRANKISVVIDGKPAAQDLPLAEVKPGAVFLETAWGNYGWSQRNLADDVYDGVFEQLVITENNGTDKEKILFDARLQGWEGIRYNLNKQWERLINWFIVNL